MSMLARGQLLRRLKLSASAAFSIVPLGRCLYCSEIRYLSSEVMHDAAGVREQSVSRPLDTKQSELSKHVQVAYETGKSMKVVTLVNEARIAGVNLSSSECIAAMLCAAKLAVGKNSSPTVLRFSENLVPTGSMKHLKPTPSSRWGSMTDLYDLSIELLSVLNGMQAVTYDAHLAAMRICSEAKSPSSAINMMKEIEDTTNYGTDEKIAAEYVKALCSAVSPDAMVDSQKERESMIRAGIAAYEAYRTIQLQNKAKAADDSVYIAAANAYAFMLGPRSSSKRLVAVLKAMMEDGFEPRVHMCRFILSAAVRFDDSELMHIMLEWFLVHFEYPLEDGVISAVMGYAVKESDLNLARLAMKLREKSFFIRKIFLENSVSDSGTEPHLSEAEDFAAVGSNGVSVWDYASAVMIAVHRKSTIATVELLTESEAMGIDILSIPLGIAVWGKFVSLCNNLRKLDALYFGLVELARQNPTTHIPRMALNAVIGASGRVGGVDRAFATFAEYDKVFGLSHDIHSYNALLLATSKHRNSKVLSMLAIFKDMESKGISPDSLSFSYLLEVMSDRNDLSGLENTLIIMKERGIRPSGRALRRSAYAACDLEKFDLVDALTAFMKTPLSIAADPKRFSPPTPLLYSFERALRRKISKIGKPIDKVMRIDHNGTASKSDSPPNKT